MKRLLICSIIRDCLPYLDRWFNQLLELQSICANEYDLYLSVYENDSEDGTDSWLSELPKRASSFKGKGAICCENLGTLHYRSVARLDRLRNLAAARQRCLDLAGYKWGLAGFDKVAYIEPDVTYDPKWCSELILANHPRAAGVGEPDIYSGWSLRSEANPKESLLLYDTCATRQTEKDLCWNFANEHKWREESLVRTGLKDVHANSLHRVWSTFNGFCVYRMEPFLYGAKWGCINQRLDTGWADLGDGWLEADTTCICERFREMGYNGVYLNTNCLIRHLT